MFTDTVGYSMEKLLEWEVRIFILTLPLTINHKPQTRYHTALALIVQWDDICEVSDTEPSTCHFFVHNEWLSTNLLCGGTQLGTKDTVGIKYLVPAFVETTAWCTSHK